MSATYYTVVATLNRVLGIAWRFVSTSRDERSGIVINKHGDTYKWLLDRNGNVVVVA